MYAFLCCHLFCTDRDGIRTVSGTQQLETFAQHAAQGMIYLSDKGIVHFGLAAKNVFVSASGICKVAIPSFVARSHFLSH